LELDPVNDGEARAKESENNGECGLKAGEPKMRKRAGEKGHLKGKAALSLSLSLSCKT
jgi:hypothetical protein